MAWEQLSPADTQYFIDNVKDDALSGVFDPALCEVYSHPYNFYKECHLLTLENRSVAPPFSFEYLKSGNDVVYLDGCTEPFDILNAKGCLNLNCETVIDYVDFYCKHVNQRPHNILLLRNPDDMPYQDTIYIDFHFDKNNYTEDDIRAEKDGNGGYIMHAPFVFAGKIDLGIATISASGQIDIKRAVER